MNVFVCFPPERHASGGYGWQQRRAVTRSGPGPDNTHNTLTQMNPVLRVMGFGALSQLLSVTPL